MAYGIIGAPEERTTQPQQVWVPVAPQFSRDMVVAHAGSSLEVRHPTTGAIDGVFTTMSAEPAGPPFVYASQIGRALDLTHDRAVLSSNIADTDSFTFITKINPYPGGLAAERYVLSRGADGFGSGWSVLFGNSTAAKPLLQMILTAGGAAYYGVTGATTLQVDTWTTLACVWNAATGSARVFVNGVLDGSATHGSSVLRDSTVNLVLGGRVDSTAESFFGRRGPTFMLKRAMSDAEVAKYSANLWQFLEADNDPVFYSLAGGGGAAALEGSLAASGAVSGALTTAIKVAASVSASASVTAALSTGIRPAASVSASATVSAALTTAIQMAGSLSATASVTGDISGAAALASSVSTSAIVTGALSTAIRLNASIAGAATVSATLTDAVAAALAASITASATVSASLTGGSSTIWTPASASSGTWTPASAAGGTWVAQ